MKFEAEIVAMRQGGAAVEVPAAFPHLGRVKGTIDGHPMQSSIASMGGGRHMLGVHKATREALGKGIGDRVVLHIEPDTAERVLEVPPDLQQAFHQEPASMAFFESLSFTHRKEYVRWITSARRAETRERRVRDAVRMLGDGVKTPDAPKR
jgi:hypothetical protein